MSKIEGVPEGWRIKGILKGAKGEKAINGYGQIVTIDDYHAQYYHTVLERDVQIIDMSQCKVDIEIQSTLYKDDWRIESFDSLKDPDFLAGRNVRVRQDYYFGWQGGECPLPDGLIVRIRIAKAEKIEHGAGVVFSVTSFEDKRLISKNINWKSKELIGYTVLGTADTHAYAHEIEGGEG